MYGHNFAELHISLFKMYTYNMCTKIEIFHQFIYNSVLSCMVPVIGAEYI